MPLKMNRAIRLKKSSIDIFMELFLERANVKY